MHRIGQLTLRPNHGPIPLDRVDPQHGGKDACEHRTPDTFGYANVMTRMADAGAYSGYVQVHVCTAEPFDLMTACAPASRDLRAMPERDAGAKRRLHKARLSTMMDFIPVPRSLARLGFSSVLAIATLAAGSVSMGAVTATTAHAMGEAPQPVVDCRKRKNRKKPECKKSNSNVTGTSAEAAAAAPNGAGIAAGTDLSDDQIYASAYALAKAGRHADARKLLLKARNANDPRILNYLGFTSRKLGEIDVAIGYYTRALALKPDYAVARSYYGEALVERGDVAAAEGQLLQIKSLCGETCEAYVRLKDRLSKAAKSG